MLLFQPSGQESFPCIDVFHGTSYCSDVKLCENETKALSLLANPLIPCASLALTTATNVVHMTGKVKVRGIKDFLKFNFDSAL